MVVIIGSFLAAALTGLWYLGHTVECGSDLRFSLVFFVRSDHLQYYDLNLWIYGRIQEEKVHAAPLVLITTCC